MKKIMFLALCASLFLSSCAGLQFTVSTGVSGQVGGQYPQQQSYPQQYPQGNCGSYSAYPGGYYEPPIITNGGTHRCPQP